MSGTNADASEFYAYMKTGEHAKDECWCGDYRDQHDSSGCRVCGSSKAPWDGCKAFRLAKRFVRTETQP